MTDKLRPKEGWHVLQLYYRIDFGSWHLLSNEEKFAAKTSFSELIQKIRAFPETQLLTLSMISAKADLGFMLLTDEQAAKRKTELVCFAVCRPEKINGRSRTGWPPVCRTGSPAYHRCNWIGRLGMGRNAVCAGHLRDQIDRLRNAIR